MTSDRGFDDDADTEDGRPEPRRGRGKSRQTGDGNQRGGNDIAEDESFGWEWLKNAISMIGNDLGRKGYQVSWIQSTIGAVEGLLGKTVTDRVLFPTIGAILRNPLVVKTALLKAGVPPQFNMLINEFIDESVEGVRDQYVRNGKLSKSDANRALTRAQTKLATRLGESTFADAVTLLPPADQTAFAGWIGGLGKDDLKKFDFYRPQLNSGSRLHALIAQPAAGRIPYLERLFGAPPQPITPAGVVDTMVKSTKEFVGAVQRYIPTPDAAQQAAADARRTTNQQHIADIKDARKKRTW